MGYFFAERLKANAILNYSARNMNYSNFTTYYSSIFKNMFNFILQTIV